MEADVVIMLKIEVDLEIRPMVNMHTSNEGSIRAEIIISLLLPIPPKVLPVSSPASVMKNLPIAKRYTTNMISPVKPAGESLRLTGTKRPASKAVVNDM
jgi:hypothetical protein